MAVYRSALGRQIDMASLAARNEKTRAVGNMKVNARGDSIDDFGRIVKPVTEKTNQVYSKTVGSRSARTTKQNLKSEINTPPVVPELSEHEMEFMETTQDDLEIESIRAKELGKK